MSFWRNLFPSHQRQRWCKNRGNICREYFNAEEKWAREKNKTFKPSRGGSYGAKLEEHKKGKKKGRKKKVK